MAPAWRGSWREIWPRLESMPGVRAAGGVSALPLSDFAAWGPITIEGHTPPPGERFINADQRTAAATTSRRCGSRFAAAGSSTSTTPSTRNVWSSSTKSWRSAIGLERIPIGKRLKFGDLGDDTPWERVVGVVGNVQQYGLDTDDRIAIYRPHAQRPGRVLYVTVHTAAEPSGLRGRRRRRGARPRSRFAPPPDDDDERARRSVRWRRAGSR